MPILIFALVVLIVCAMLVYAVDCVPMTAPFNGLVKLLIVIVGALAILDRAGLL